MKVQNMMSKKGDKPLNNFIVVVGVATMWAGFEFFRRITNQLAHGTREQANNALRDATINSIADRMDMPIATIYRILENPNSDPEVFDQIRRAIRKIEVLFQKPRSVGEKPVPVVLKIHWSDNNSTLIAQDWPINLLPPEVRGLLIQQPSVTVEWELPDLQKN
ncbi:MAG: hypothetical protein SGI87_05530 [Flavobacteriales bacterium]|nr:hypothetical protein [Flavobacteriales bacterium]